ncbi:SURF1 family protein [Litorivivens sp.]|uniref:SURF1 family protein n=1 Tax=Litorivivens sp. TaxID=2020868 RepID=UPI0035637F63
MKLTALRKNWPLALLVAFIVPVLLTLGFWQLQRAQDKQQVLQQQQAQQMLPPLVLNNVRADLPEFRAVTIRGRFDPVRYWLLENRIHNGQYGFEVVSPFELENGDTVLVHRGWLAGDRGRRLLPEVQTPDGLITLTGFLDRGGASGFSLGEEETGEGWPKRLQWLPIARAEQHLGKPLPNLLLRLERGQPGMYTPTYSAVNMPPEKHTGYAVQWFGMAAIIIALFGWHLWRQLSTSGERT